MVHPKNQKHKKSAVAKKQRYNSNDTSLSCNFLPQSFSIVLAQEKDSLEIQFFAIVLNS